MDARFALPAVNFLLADVGGGLGPFLSTWLAEAQGWTPGQVGTVVAAGAAAGAACAGPAGSLVDRLGRPRLMLAVSCGAIVAGTLALLFLGGFVPVMLAQLVVAAGGALGTPAITGLTLAVVGKDRFPEQQGTNNAANHAGNVAAALLIGGLAWAMGATASIAVLVVFAAGTVGVLWSMNGDDIDGERMRGRKKREKGEKRGATRALLRNRRIWLLLAVVMLFQLGSSAMLPLLGQRVVAQGDGHGTSWMSACVIVAQLTMIPVAFATGKLADRLGRRTLLVFCCAVAGARCLVAVFATGNWWLIPIEVLDGLGAGVFSVALPVAVADLTYGGGRTQTAMGGAGAVQAAGGALATFGGGWLAQRMGFGWTFGAMAVFPAAAAALLVFASVTAEGGTAEGGKAEGDQAEGGGTPSGKAADIRDAA